MNKLLDTSLCLLLYLKVLIARCALYHVRTCLTCFSEELLRGDPEAGDDQHGVDGQGEADVRDRQGHQQDVGGPVAK